jgi:type I restriction enzyme S subunit
MENKLQTEWSLKRINSFAKLVSGSTPSTFKKEFWNGSIVWITPEDLSNIENIYVSTSERKITNEGLKKGIRMIPKRSVVMSSRAPIGYLAIPIVDYTTNQGCKSFVPYPNSGINPEFLYYSLYFNMPRIKRIGEGTTFDEISKSKLEQIDLLIPNDPAKQEKISSILLQIDNYIILIRNLIQKLIKLKIAVVEEIFTKGLRNDDTISRIINSKSYLIPKSWKVMTIQGSSVLKGRIGWQGLSTSEYLDDGDYLLVTGTDFENGSIVWQKCHFVSKNRYLQDSYIQLKTGDVLITKDGTIGKIAYVDKLPKKATLNSGIFVLRPLNNKYMSKYMYHVLNSKFFRNFIENLQAGSTISHLYQKDFVNFEFPLPEILDEQIKICRILDTLDIKISIEKQYLSKILKIKKGMLADLLLPKIRVIY